MIDRKSGAKSKIDDWKQRTRQLSGRRLAPDRPTVKVIGDLVRCDAHAVVVETGNKRTRLDGRLVDDMPRLGFIDAFVPDMQSAPKSGVRMAVILDSVDFDARGRVFCGLKRRQPERGPGSRAGRKAHPRLEISILNARPGAGGVGGGEEAGAPPAVGAAARGDLKLAALYRERPVRARIGEARVAEIAIPGRVRGPARAVEDAWRNEEIHKILDHHRLEVAKIEPLVGDRTHGRGGEGDEEGLGAPNDHSINISRLSSTCLRI